MTILIQRCGDCGRPNYPARAVCGACLSDKLSDQEDTGLGVLLACSRLHRSLEAAHRAALPFRIGAVRLESGPHVLALVEDAAAEAGAQVRLEPGRNGLGEPVWRARLA